jgi:hypothetical protein
VLSLACAGAGFSGFWYHLGLFSGADLRERDFYCYSSGCLGLVLAAARVDVEDVVAVASSVQSAWRNGQLSRYDIVDVFLRELLSTEKCAFKARNISCIIQSLHSFLPRLHILVTTLDKNGGMEPHVRTATTHTELIRLLKQTTHIPWVTGPAVAGALDGGFSRAWHPACETVVTVPPTWPVMLHSLNPGLDRDVAATLYKMGVNDSVMNNNTISSANQRQDRDTTSLFSQTKYLLPRSAALFLLSEVATT